MQPARQSYQTTRRANRHARWQHKRELAACDFADFASYQRNQLTAPTLAPLPKPPVDSFGRFLRAQAMRRAEFENYAYFRGLYERGVADLLRYDVPRNRVEVVMQLFGVNNMLANRASIRARAAKVLRRVA